jgi:hypothetical protein
LRIALVFGVGLDHFFGDGEDRPVLEIVRGKDRLRLPDTSEASPTYFFESLDFPVNDRPIDSYLAEFRPGRPPSAPHRHTGAEMIYLIDGALDLVIHDTTHALEAGDSMYFDARYDHSYRCRGEDRATAVVVVTASID